MLTPSELDDVRELVAEEFRARMRRLYRSYLITAFCFAVVTVSDIVRVSFQYGALQKLLANLSEVLANVRH